MTEAQLDDDYVRRTASFIRTNERQLAGIQMPKYSSPLNPLSWVGVGAAPQKSMILTLSIDQLSYLLTRIQGIGLNVGNLDIQMENPPMGFVTHPSGSYKTKEDDALSISTNVSHLSLAPSSYYQSWWSSPTPIDAELKYIYSSFTKLPSLHLKPPLTPPTNLPKSTSAIPLDVFKNLQMLTVQDLDPRSLLGWDRLADSLRSLTVKRSGLEDVTHLMVDAVMDDQTRRQRNDHLSPIRRKSLVHRPVPSRARQASWSAGRFGHAVTIREHEEDPSQMPHSTEPPDDSSSSNSAASPPALSSSKWRRLRHLSFADNNLTFFSITPIPYLTSLLHLDLSSNLLISVPPGLGELYNLISLNLSNNMIDSVLGIYTLLGSITTLNISENRLDSLCGLERLAALERIDLRNNKIEESDEVGRLAVLPNVAQVWVSGNPFITIEGNDHRIRCFKHFAKEGKEILLDGSLPGWMERRTIDACLGGTPVLGPTTTTPVLRSSPRTPNNASRAHSRASSSSAHMTSSPTMLPPSPLPAGSNSEGVPKPHPSHGDGFSSSNQLLPPLSSSPPTGATIVVPPKKRKKTARIVDLDRNSEDKSAITNKHTRRVARGGGESSDGAGTASRDRSPDPRTLLQPGGDRPDVAGILSSSPSSIGEWSVLGDKKRNDAVEATALASAASDSAANRHTTRFAPSSPPSKDSPTGRAYGRQGKYKTELLPSANGFDADELAPLPLSTSPEKRPYSKGMSPPAIDSAASRRIPSSYATMDGRMGKKDSRRSRVSASVYEPSSPVKSETSSSPPNGSSSPQRFNTEAEAFRSRIETLRHEVGDSWLKVLSQSGTLGNTGLAPPFQGSSNGDRLSSIVAAASTSGNDMGRLSPTSRAKAGLSSEV